MLRKSVHLKLFYRKETPAQDTRKSYKTRSTNNKTKERLSAELMNIDITRDSGK